MREQRTLLVKSNGLSVGTLTSNNSFWSFQYSAPWQASCDSFSLSPALSLAVQQHIDSISYRPVEWYFDNLLPEEGLRTLLATEGGVHEADSFDLLNILGSESAGALELSRVGEVVGRGPTCVPMPLEQLSRRIAALPWVSLQNEAPSRSVVAGAQHKMVILYEHGSLFEPVQGSASTHILKPNSPSSDYPASAMNEYFMMKLAASVGLEVPEVHRLYAPAPVYIVQRFDRESSSGAIRRRHIIDTCQLLGLSRHSKYEQASLSTLAKAVAHCADAPSARRQLYRWVLFNFFIGNADNHLKNLSFELSAAGLDLAPSYDLLSTAVYDTASFKDFGAQWPHVQLALPLEGATYFDQVTQASLLRAGAVLGLSEATAERELAVLEEMLPCKADSLIESIAFENQGFAHLRPAPADALNYFAGELRLLRAIRHVILKTTLALAQRV